MLEFMKMWDNNGYKYGLTLNIYYSSIVDWNLTIAKKVTVDENRTAIIEITNESDVDMMFAKSYIRFGEWLSENKGGY